MINIVDGKSIEIMEISDLTLLLIFFNKIILVFQKDLRKKFLTFGHKKVMPKTVCTLYILFKIC